MFKFVVLMPEYIGPGIHIIPIGVTYRIKGYKKNLALFKFGPNCLGCLAFRIWIVEWVFKFVSFGSLKCLIDTEFESISMNS